jgi:nucleoside-diphosphate-sugar epimerase
MFDFIFAQDVAEGLKRLAFTPEAKGVINLGTGHGRSVKEVSELIRAKTQQGPDTDNWECSWASIAYLRLVTGWTPQISLEDGIKRVLSA